MAQQQLDILKISQELSRQSHDLQQVVNRQIDDDWRLNYLRFRELLEELVDSSEIIVKMLPQATLDMIGDILEESPTGIQNVIATSVRMQVIETEIAQAVQTLKGH
ncbi:hypothetical protein [uncultured Secundilactobacillus sp.]|uniref:hypothetical protein n=1 Tax=uncultured Secundilactobacillus sp. TaxID=2813935 RepID=UPI00258A025E|nr:hypothetical protein [uncultured Secundilactobacillus sp.]